MYTLQATPALSAGLAQLLFSLTPRPCLPTPCSSRDNLHEIIIIGRWVLLGLLCAQVVAIALASCLRCCSKGRSYEEFQEEEEAEYDARRAAAAEQLDALKAKLGLAAVQEGGAPGGSKRVISLTAVSGLAAERQHQEQQQQRAMRSSLFARSEAAEPTEDGKLEADMEAGKIGTR